MPSVAKLVLVVFLGGLAVFLGSLVMTLEVVLVQKRLLFAKGMHHHKKKDSTSSDFSNKNLLQTLIPTEETKDLQLWKTQRRDDRDAQAYWNQVIPYLKQWDALLENNNDNDEKGPSSLPPATSHIFTSLQQAARLGHSEAQYYIANAMASGILPFHLPQDKHNLTVPVDMIPHFSDKNDPSVVQSYLYWHMAAMDGHIPSAVTLGYRNYDSCEISLAYYQEAAHAIVDALERSPSSRAKVLPRMDQHELTQIHLVGSTASHFLHHTNQPDEPQDAIRYYHMRAVSNNDYKAAYTLAQLYHYGLRGVTQNLTIALQYYDMGAKLGHWEAAGQAGKFHLLGLGMDYGKRNLVKASWYFKKGAPFDLDTCRRRFRNAQLQKHKRSSSTAFQDGDDENVSQCDHPSLNGLGLLHLWGMPTLLDRNVELAEKYFELSRDMGNMDASYNLAMMRLGWKTHYKTLDHLGEDPQQYTTTTSTTSSSNDVLFLSSPQKPGPTKADYLVALTDLAAAANKEHLQAKHRLGMLYAHGINGPPGGSVIMERDCTKALKHFTWVAEHANPYLSHATTRAYKFYVGGNWEAALYHYLQAAEMGHQVSQVNAAFLLEQGVCPSLDKPKCAAASLRLWKAAVLSNPEAALRVGDMYYYGRLRRESGERGWLNVLLFPERHVVPLARHVWKRVKSFVWRPNKMVPDSEETTTTTTCRVAEDEDGTCLAPDHKAFVDKKSVVEQDLEMAEKYYTLASEVHKSARAHFNLGFLYEWGLGVKQDFPLAKRHYDLAGNSGEAEVAVQMALLSMNWHERLVKLHASYQEWWRRRSTTTTEQREESHSKNMNQNDIVSIPMATVEEDVGHPVPNMSQNAPRTKTDVIISHLLSWESFLIVILTIVLSKLLRHRRTP